MEWTKISTIIGTVLLVTVLTLKLAGYETEREISEPNESKFEYRETKGIPICPYCQKATIRTGGYGSVTLLGYTPIYDENGNNTNPDRNTFTSEWYCQECEKSYGTFGNAYDGYDYCGEFDKIKPNEPEILHNSEIMSEPEVSVDIYNLLVKCIPTWPDYIELEKDLIICWPKTKVEGLEWDYQPRITMAKGAKIFFKE